MLRYLLRTLLHMNLFAESLAAEGSNSSALLRAAALDARNGSAPHGSALPPLQEEEEEAEEAPPSVSPVSPSPAWRAPRIVEAPRDALVARGRAATLRCRAEGRPAPRVRWLRDGAPLRPPPATGATRRLSLRGGTLTVAGARPSDAGAYVCVAANAAGRRESAPALLRVLEPPVIRTRPRGRAVLAAGTAELACEARGDPAPAVRWRKERGELPPGRWQQRPDNALRISRVTPADEGTYTCVAENGAGRAEASAALRVHVPPQLVTPPRDQAVAPGRTATFACETRGRPPPAVFWHKEGTQVLVFPGQPPGRVSVAASGRLSIAEVAPDDGGYYTCQAVSVAGSARARALLRVRDDAPEGLPPSPSPDPGTPPPEPSAPSPCPAPGCTAPSPRPPLAAAAASPAPTSPPAPPSAPRVTAVTHSTVSLAWDAAGPVTSYVVEAFSQASGGVWRTVATEVPAPEHTVTGLRPATVYLFLVRAVNAFGLSEASGASEPVCTRRDGDDDDDGGGGGGDEGTAEPPAEPLAVHLEEPVVLPTGTVRLTWTVSGAWAPLRGYRLLYRRRGAAAWEAREVPGGAQRAALLAGLQPAQLYELQVRAVAEGPRGAASAVRALRTPERAPGGPPRAVRASRLPDGAAAVSWEPPPPAERNGVIRDYWVWCLANESRFDVNASVAGPALGAVLRGLAPGVPYRAQVAAATAAGVGVPSAPVPVRPAPAAPVGRDGGGGGLAERLAALATRPAFLAGVAGAAWLLLAGSGACVYLRRRRKREPRGDFPRAGSSGCRIPRPGPYPWLADTWPDAPWEPPGALGWLRPGKPGSGGDIAVPTGSLGSSVGKAAPTVPPPWPELLPPPPPLSGEPSLYEEEEEEEEPAASPGLDERWPPSPERARGAAADHVPRLRELDARRAPRRPHNGTLPRAASPGAGEPARRSPGRSAAPGGRPKAGGSRVERSARGGGARPREAEGSRRRPELPPPPPLPPEELERRAAPHPDDVLPAGKAALVASSRGSTGSRGHGRSRTPEPTARGATPPLSPLFPFPLAGEEPKALARVTLGLGTRGDDL